MASDTSTELIASFEKHFEDATARGLANAVGAAMRDGSLRPGVQLPPIRTVAAQLQISPTTVSAAWALLRRSGTITTDGRRGTMVGQLPIGNALRLGRTVDLAASLDIDLSSGVPDPELLPDLRPAMRGVRAAPTTASYLDDPTLPELKASILADWPFRSTDLMVVDGAMDAIELFARTSLQFGDRVIVEHPGFPPIQDLLTFRGARVVPVAVDAEGLVVEEMAVALRQNVAAVFLQPRAHNPTGASMTARRAAALAGLLDRTQTIVVEDDSAGAIASTALVSLGTLLPDRTVHVRSFSKSHGPDLRLGAMSAPPALLAAMAARRRLGQGWTSRLLQHVLLQMLLEPRSVAAVAHAREEYRRRRVGLVAALAALGIDVGGDDGVNIWVPVQDEAAAVLRLATQGIGVAPGSPFMGRADPRQFIRVTSARARGDLTVLAGHIADAAAQRPWATQR